MTSRLCCRSTRTGGDLLFPHHRGPALLRFTRVWYPSMQLLSRELLRNSVGSIPLNDGSCNASADLGTATDDLCTGFGDLVQTTAYAMIEPTSASDAAVHAYEGPHLAVPRDAEHAR